MKKPAFLLMVLSLMLTPMMAFAHSESDPYMTDLIAGQNTDAGDVLVWNDADYLYVKYETHEPWCLVETHLAVGDELGDIPQTTKGSPIPGRFAYKTYHGLEPCVTEYVYQIPLPDVGGICNADLIIAAHAAVVQKNDCGKVVAKETGWGAGCEFPGRNWSMYFAYTVQCEITEEWPCGGTTTVAFEDLPLNGNLDYDYNDWISDIDITAAFLGSSTTDRDLTNMDFIITPEARGAGYNHAFHMLIPANTFGCGGTYTLILRDGSANPLNTSTGPFDASVDNDFTLIPDTTEALLSFLTNTVEPTGILSHYPNIGNTDPSAPRHEPYVQSERSAVLSIDFGDGCYFDFDAYDPYSSFHGEGLFFDPYLYVNNTGDEIHVGDVRMLTVPTDWMWPEAGVGIWLAYTNGVSSGPPPTFSTDWWITYNDLVYDGRP
jgi:hypothetical protein